MGPINHGGGGRENGRNKKKKRERLPTSTSVLLMYLACTLISLLGCKMGGVEAQTSIDNFFLVMIFFWV